MGSTSRLALPYPEPSSANDVPKDIKALADGIAPIIAADYQGTLSARPAAGVRGRYYWATDDALFRDNGTAWIRLTPGPWKTWTPTITVISARGTTITTTDFLVQGTPTYQYRLLPGNGVEFELHASARLFGTQQFVGIRFTLPVTGDTTQRPHPADCFNSLARAISTSANLDVSPYQGYGWYGQAHDTTDNLAQSQWLVDGVNRWFQVRGSYHYA